MGRRVSGASCSERRAGIPSNPVAWPDRRRPPSPRSATSAAGCCASRGKRTGRARMWRSCTARPSQAVAQIVLLRPQHARYLRLVQPDQLARSRQAGVGRPGVGGRGAGCARRRDSSGNGRCWLSPCEHLTTRVGRRGRPMLVYRPRRWWRHGRLRLRRRELPR
jgi:hypothetical protein